MATINDYPFRGRTALYEGEHNGIRWCIYQAPLSGVLNGYTRIPEGHSVDVDTLDVHGGITYGSGKCSGWITSHPIYRDHVNTTALLCSRSGATTAKTSLPTPDPKPSTGASHPERSNHERACHDRLPCCGG